jgi:hypothetical protein
MVKKRNLIIIDVCLGLILFVLLLNVFNVNLPSLGKAYYDRLPGEATCLTSWQDDFSSLDIDRCCLLARQQLTCQRTDLFYQGEDYKQVCSTGNSVKYWLNAKAKAYCRQVDY